jgi:hypothetical protein
MRLCEYVSCTRRSFQRCLIFNLHKENLYISYSLSQNSRRVAENIYPRAHRAYILNSFHSLLECKHFVEADWLAGWRAKKKKKCVPSKSCRGWTGTSFPSRFRRRERVLNGDGSCEDRDSACRTERSGQTARRRALYLEVNVHQTLKRPPEYRRRAREPLLN